MQNKSEKCKFLPTQKIKRNPRAERTQTCKKKEALSYEKEEEEHTVKTANNHRAINKATSRLKRKRKKVKGILNISSKTVPNIYIH